MTKKKRVPLGYIELETGNKEITATNDIFLTYMFRNSENWEILRLILNIFINEFIKLHKEKDPVPSPITGTIEVTTQYEYFLDTEKTTRVQDIRLDYVESIFDTEKYIKFQKDSSDTIFIEFQNKTNTIPAIKTRAIEYFGLGIGHNKGKLANQIWLLSEDIKELLHNQSFTNYILRDNVTDEIYPNNSSMMFVSLKKLSKENNIAGELARFLLGEEIDPTYDEVKTIIKSFNNSFKTFKEDKGVKTVMTVKERFKNEGFVDGIEQGIEQGIFAVAKNAISLGLSLEQISKLTGLNYEILLQLKEEINK
jgi:predicted transposase/invertase (TIGR01784 family)